MVLFTPAPYAGSTPNMGLRFKTPFLTPSPFMGLAMSCHRGIPSQVVLEEIMPRKPSAVLEYKLRIRESLRRQLAQAAEKHGVSMNAEMVRRLEESFTRESNRSIGENAQLIQTSAESIVAATRVLEAAAKLSGGGALKVDLTSLSAAERARQESEGSGS
jgi:hypothetical protein